MKLIVFFALLLILGLAFWGCPTKKYVPDRSPPQPQVQWILEDTPGYLGREPYVGPKIQWERMLAQFRELSPESI
ncbi:MAG: hypothetical protein ACXVCY_09815 [Pseudobdellovibrionaceae bacterium]